ncbi:MAG TPA: hypothetical protein VG826_04090 [Pirellulales bacterium]|nr:hypothetical protein [Pirellulales bacterium]
MRSENWSPSEGPHEEDEEDEAGEAVKAVTAEVEFSLPGDDAHDAVPVERKKKVGKQRLKLHELRKILKSFGDIQEDASAGKGSHTTFIRSVGGRKFSYPIPTTSRDVKPCYVKGVRRHLKLMPSDGVPDDDFFSRK